MEACLTNDPWLMSKNRKDLAKYLADYLEYERTILDNVNIDADMLGHAIDAFKSTNEYSLIVL